MEILGQSRPKFQRTLHTNGGGYRRQNSEKCKSTRIFISFESHSQINWLLCLAVARDFCPFLPRHLTKSWPIIFVPSRYVICDNVVHDIEVSNHINICSINKDIPDLNITASLRTRQDYEWAIRRSNFCKSVGGHSSNSVKWTSVRLRRPRDYNLPFMLSYLMALSSLLPAYEPTSQQMYPSDFCKYLASSECLTFLSVHF